MVCTSIIDCIGNTPLVEIGKLNPIPGVKIFAKLEYMNPGGSIKDRAALHMICAAEKSGELTPKKTVIEATSGNTGIGLAMICAVKGYKLALTMAENASEERKSILRARGAQIILTPEHQGSDGAIEEAYRLARQNPELYFLTDQYNNEANWQAHYQTTGPEIADQVPENLTSLVATVGTSGTLMGLSRYLKERDLSTRIICVEPYLGHKIQGLKNMKESYTPEIYDKAKLDQVVHVEDAMAFETARQLAVQEGLFVGMSSGAAMAAAIEEARRIKKGVVVAIFPDSGERYLSTPLFSVKKNIQLDLYNTLSRNKERFVPLGEDQVSVYTCGPTVHQRLHLGMFRRFVFTDLLVRYLEFLRLKVNHVINLTDYDDKTIEGAMEAGLSLADFTSPHIDAFKRDLGLLGIRKAQSYPVVSAHFPEMIEVCQALLSKGHAYEKLHSVYFDIASMPGYGELSNVDLNKIRLGATVDLDQYEKRNPRDFTLFKRVRLSELKQGIGVRTQWGNVRPSLHLQCAAISKKYLGDRFDIHTGSRELIFPHHENEIAIAEGAGGGCPANVWVHCGQVRYDGSLGPERLEDVFLDSLSDQGWDLKTIRFWFFSAHHRKTLVLSKKRLDQASFTLGKINRCIEVLGEIAKDLDCKGDELASDQLAYDIRQGIVRAMEDDMNVSTLVSSLLAGVKRINQLISRSRIGSSGALGLLSGFRAADQFLRVFDFHKKMEYSPETLALIKNREDARSAGDWALADSIRETLENMGVHLHDKKV